MIILSKILSSQAISLRFSKKIKPSLLPQRQVAASPLLLLALPLSPSPSFQACLPPFTFQVSLSQFCEQFFRGIQFHTHIWAMPSQGFFFELSLDFMVWGWICGCKWVGFMTISSFFMVRHFPQLILWMHRLVHSGMATPLRRAFQIWRLLHYATRS